MKKTTNYQLNQWEKTDGVLMADFNADNQKIDEAIKNAGHVVCDTYIGTGTCGAANPCVLTFPFNPALVVIKPGSTGTDMMIALQGCPTANTNTGSTNSDYIANLTWSENTLHWYNTCSYAGDQLNAAGTTYYYMAIG